MGKTTTQHMDLVQQKFTNCQRPFSQLSSLISAAEGFHEETGVLYDRHAKRVDELRKELGIGQQNSSELEALLEGTEDVEKDSVIATIDNRISEITDLQAQNRDDRQEAGEQLRDALNEFKQAINNFQTFVDGKKKRIVRGRTTLAAAEEFIRSMLNSWKVMANVYRNS